MSIRIFDIEKKIKSQRDKMKKKKRKKNRNGTNNS